MLRIRFWREPFSTDQIPGLVEWAVQNGVTDVTFTRVPYSEFPDYLQESVRAVDILELPIDIFLSRGSTLDYLLGKTSRHNTIAAHSLVPEMGDVCFLRWDRSEVRKEAFFWLPITAVHELKLAYQAARHMEEDIGFVPYSVTNLRHIERACSRAAEKEGITLDGTEIQVVAGMIFVHHPSMRFMRRIYDFVAHAVSAGWIGVNWETENKIIVGWDLMFRNGFVDNGAPPHDGVVHMKLHCLVR